MSTFFDSVKSSYDTVDNEHEEMTSNRRVQVVHGILSVFLFGQHMAFY